MTEILITSSILILAVLLLRRLLRGRVSRRSQYALWLVVALRLLLPVSVPAPTSVMNAIHHPGETAAVGETVYVGTRFAPAQADPVLPEAAEPSPAPHNTPGDWLLPLWGAGAAAVGAAFVGVNLSFGRRLKRSRRPLPVQNCPLPVYLAEGLPSPCLFGLLHPAIYIPPQAAQQPDMLPHILTHEHCHYRQGDHIWSLVRCVCLALYWFDPLVWAAACLSRTDCELACDELAVRTLGEEHKTAYGRTLLSLVQQGASLSQLACTATTMAGSERGLKQRIRMIAASPKTTAGMAAGLAMGVCLLVSCTFTGKSLTAAEAVQAVEVRAEGRSVAFTLPREYADGADWDIAVYGMAEQENGFTSVQLFEEENAGRSWQPGSTYTVDLDAARYTRLTLELSLHSDESLGRTVDLLELAGGTGEGYNTVYITFPAYREERAGYVGTVMDTAPFDAKLTLPAAWNVTFPDDRTSADGPLWNTMELYSETDLEATIGFGSYQRYQGDDYAPGDYYKTVYPELRLSRVCSWDDYRPVRTTATQESALATVRYIEPDLPENAGQNWAALPEKQAPGILCYNDELQVYVGIQFREGREPSDELLLMLADSLELQPSAYGRSGRRFDGYYAAPEYRDYSGIRILDADGVDVSAILIDLWYCACDAYDVDGTTLFENGDWVTLDENLPQFIELTDYDTVIRSVFTPAAIAEYERSDVAMIRKTPDGKVYRLGPWKTGYSYGFAMTDMEAVQVEPDRITARVTYEKSAGYAGAYEDPAYVPEYGSVEFTVVCQDGVWLVDSYTYPG